MLPSGGALEPGADDVGLAGQLEAYIGRCDPMAAGTMRLMRASMLEHLRQDLVRSLRAAGLPEWKVVGLHVFRNALIPIVSLAGLRLGWLIGYTLIVETVFNWPGVGYLLVDSVVRRDYPVAQFFSLLLVVAVVLANWLADVLYGLVDPRIRYA